MKKKLFLYSIFVLLLITGCGNGDENSIKKLNVNFEKYDLPCVSGEVCAEVKGKIVQIESYNGMVNNEVYNTIILTNDGNIYLYDSLFDKKMIKINGGTKLTHIDGTLDSSYYYNLLIYQDENYYSIEKDGTIKEINFDFDAKTILSHERDGSRIVDEDGTLILYMPCSKYKNIIGSDRCPTDKTWVKISPSADSFIKDFKIKYANTRVLVTSEGEMYPNILDFKWDHKKFTYEPYIDENAFADYLLISNPKNIWHWNDGASSRSHLLVQAKDKNIYYQWNSFSSTNKKFETKIVFNENVEKALFSGNDSNFLIIGESNVYLANSNFDDNYDLTKLDELKKYKDDIRNFYMKNYVLLSDGNLYKVFEG